MQLDRKLLVKNFKKDLKKDEDLGKREKEELEAKFPYVVSQGIDNLNKLKSSGKFPCIKVINNKTILYRIQKAKHSVNSLHFSTDDSSRFNFPSVYIQKDKDHKLGVSYLSIDLVVALLETFARAKIQFYPAQDKESIMHMPIEDVNKFNLLQISVKQDINLLNLTNHTVLHCLGVDLSHILGISYTFPRYLSYLIHEELQDIDGLYYLSKTNAGDNIALYKRAKNKVEISYAWRLTDSYIYPTVKHMLYINGGIEIMEE